MPMQTLEQAIFEVNESNFEETALKVFNFQANTNPIYQKFIQLLDIDSNAVQSIQDIPFLPIDFFKSQLILCRDECKSEPTPKIKENINSNDTNSKNDNEITKSLQPKESKIEKVQAMFSSSGTTGQIQSKHYVKKRSLYEKSFQLSFAQFYGDIKDYCLLALLPAYLERTGSSLIYMVDNLIKQSNHPQSGFYLNEFDQLYQTLQKLEQQQQPTILIGVTFALLDFAETYKSPLKNTIVMETGGMKGRRKEIIREEVHAILQNSFGSKPIHSEYGMTELLSQAYSKGDGLYQTPSWMKVLIRETNDPFAYRSVGQSGAINIIDLANLYSCSFIATADLGRFIAKSDKTTNTQFEVLGRMDNSDIRGCSLLT